MHQSTDPSINFCCVKFVKVGGAVDIAGSVFHETMLKAVRSLLGRPPSVEPPPRWWHFSTAADGHHYMWRGAGPERGSNIIAVYDPSSELWSLLPTTGPLPPGEGGGCSVCVGRCLFTFGGPDGSSYFNDMSKLDLDTLQWTKVQTSGSQPMKKAFCGLVRVNERTLCCFGGEGIEGTTQPGSTFTKTGLGDGSGYTNEFHFFDTQNGVWSSPELRGERPPPCSIFTFTMVDQHRAVLFGGSQSGRGRLNDVYLFDFRTMGEPWPVVRDSHAACCLNYGQDHPQLLVYGGLDNGYNVLGDMWILDVDTVKWTEVTPPESMTPRYQYSITATSLRPGLTEVLLFGGRRKVWGGDAIAETTILRFELTGPSASVAGPSAGKWALVDVAHNSTRGSAQRLSEKRISQATACASSVSETTDHSSQDRVRALEQQLRAAEQREHDTQCHHQLQLQEKDRELAIKNQESAMKDRQLTEANHRHGNAEERAQLAEQREQATQLLLQVKDRELAEANRREADLSVRITALERELEGKTKELAAHNTEVWRIPANRVIIGRRIGKGGWGEVLEGTVSVAVKRLHEEIALPIYIEKMEREMRLLAEVRHPNLVQFIGAIFDEQRQANRSPPLIITELLDMNLRQAYERNQLDPGNRLSIFKDIALALDYLHQRYNPIIHRDVSAPNVLLQRMPNHQLKGKVSDLGSANFLQHSHTMGEGAIIYSPPEVIPQPLVRPPPQTVKIDVYSYGIVLAEVTASRFPSQDNFPEMFERIKRERPAVYKLILRCIEREPSHRPSMAQTMLNSFLSLVYQLNHHLIVVHSLLQLTDAVTCGGRWILKRGLTSLLCVIQALNCGASCPCTTGPLYIPPGEYGGCSVCVGRYLFTNLVVRMGILTSMT
ncbi:uncharacterized protein LOC135340941 isoform X2 [Halichondria panicea]|uniref:uncharacterized protein LOC135340941 isoform X2 n=1 Tax=Halichondria panicea TaxID=6063 RepID=UPI00312B381F